MQSFKISLRYRSIILFSILLACSACSTPEKNSWAAGEELIKKLQANSPKIHDVPMRTYVYQDLNHDNQFEIIEKVNTIEEEAPEFLNTELYPAFEQHQVYTYKDGKYQPDNSLASDYYTDRAEFYKFWRRHILNPVNLSDDSRQVVLENRSLFLQEIQRLLALSQKLVE